MNLKLRFGSLSLILSTPFALIAAEAVSRPAATASFSLDAVRPGPVINRNIYGHFAEHLGRCIYEGIWVGEDSPIPHTRSSRNDVIAALRRINVPGAPLARTWRRPIS